MVTEMQRKRSVARWCLMGMGLLCALGVVNGDFLGVFAQQSSANLQLLPLQIIGQSNLKNLVLGVTVRNNGTTDVNFRLGFSLRKVGQLNERPDGVEVGECFIADCTIKGRGTENPTAPPVDKVVQLILKISQNEILEQNSTYQLNVYVQPYNIDTQGCSNRVCVGQPFFKYDAPELHPIMLNLNPPSPAQEGSKIFVQTSIENTGSGLPDGSKLEVSFRYCRQLTSVPCDPDIEFKKIMIESNNLSALTPKFLGAATTMDVPLDDRTESQVLLDAEQLKLTGQIRIKVFLKLSLPVNSQGLPIREADENNNEIITTYRVLTRTAITQLVVSPLGHFGYVGANNSVIITGMISYFDRNSRQVCTYPKDTFQQEDPRIPQKIAAIQNCFAFDLEEMTDMVLRTSPNDAKICDIFMARPDGYVSRARCALEKSLNLVHLINPKAKENLRLAQEQGAEPFEFARDKFDPKTHRTLIDQGRRLNQMLLVERFNKLIISTARGKIYSLDAVKAEDFDSQTQKPELVLDAGLDASIDSMKFFGANILAAANLRTGDKGQFYFLRSEVSGKFVGSPVKRGQITSQNNLETPTGERIVAFEYDGENKRLIVATSQSVIFYSFPDTNAALVANDPVLATCKVAANQEIKDMLFLKRDIINKQGGNSVINIVALALSNKGKSDGEVQFLNAPSSLRGTNECKKAETPNNLPIATSGLISKLIRATEIPVAFRNVAPDQPIFVFATALDGRIYPVRVGVKDFNPELLIAQAAPNEEGLSTPFFPVQPIQETPVIEASVTSKDGSPINGSPAVLVFYVAESVNCRRYIPLEDSISRQLTLCNDSPLFGGFSATISQR
jgi:hypothetical protein